MSSSHESRQTWYYGYPDYIFSAQFIAQLNYFPLHPISYQASLSNMYTYISIHHIFLFVSIATHIYCILYDTPALYGSHIHTFEWLLRLITESFSTLHIPTVTEDSLLYIQNSTNGFFCEPDYSHHRPVIHLNC